MPRNPDATISDLLATAARLFVSRSYDDIKLTDIARDSGVTKGAIYHHFDSKEDVFLSMMALKLKTFQADLRPALTWGQTARERLHRLTFLYLNKPREEQRVIQLVRRDAQRFHGEARRTLIHSYQAALPDQIEQILSSGMEAGEIVLGDAQLLARLFVAHVEVYLSDYARGRFEDASDMATYITDLFLTGVATRPAQMATGKSATATPLSPLIGESQ